VIEENKLKSKDTWVGYRPEIKVFDCTVRDGGLINNHLFEDSFVRGVYDALVGAGVDYMEVGYKASKRIFARDENGDWKYCDEDDMRRVLDDNPNPIKLSVMADAEKSDYKEDILPKDQSILDCIRVACYVHQIPLAIDMAKDAHDKGYETAVNIMAASTVQENDLQQALDELAGSPADTIYLVDSFGAFYSEEIRELMAAYLKAVEGTGKQIGIHAHNNLQLAYSNTIEALIAGANRLDATINGMGRGAGNCPLEILLGFLHNPKFHQRPILECIRDHFLPLQKDMEWGYQLAYMVTGQLNQHPRAAIRMRAGENPDDCVAFFDQITAES